MENVVKTREEYAAADLEWRIAFRTAFALFTSQDGFDELEFIHYAGIGPRQWIMLCDKDRISNDPYLYAKIFYHAGIIQADPRLLPPRILIQFGEVVTERRRALWDDEFVSWAQTQKPSFISIWKDEVMLAAVDVSLKLLAELITFLIQSERGQRDEFVRNNGKLLSFIIPFLTALSMDGAPRERELMRLVTLNGLTVLKGDS